MTLRTERADPISQSGLLSKARRLSSEIVCNVGEGLFII